MKGNSAATTSAPSNMAAANKLMWLSLFFILIGVSGAVYAQMVGHHHAFANTREMPWGMLIGVYAYFAIISTGLCVLAAFSHAFGGNQMAPLANRMVWLSIISLLGAFMVIGLEIENPWRMPLGVILYPNVTSNIWWMGTLYGMAVGVMFLELLLILTKRYKLAIFLGVIAAITEALANSNLGAVFASLQARPFWYGSQLPVFFLACAVLSGAAAIVIFTYFSHILQKRPMDEHTFRGLQTAGKIMVLMTFLVTLATLWKFINASVSNQELALAADSLLKGPLAINFWVFEIGIGLILPGLLLVITRLKSIHVLSAAALMILVGQFFSRFNMVVSGEIVPFDYEYVGVPQYLSYTPSIAEYLLVIAGLGVVGFGFVIGERFFDETFHAGSH
ncbi:polysulfide reductase NrfD [Desulfopila sp. IMCC35006]|uniref:NrfD/PsrC family molybdoenzyme membrane anchor subunit n=1 Tax=Desulfopila sp. IMCC35006 TaxID=2569542 RepID=UPI0010ACDF89|nr:NrfD/PsrC family molybdoenzyme membrane anchor subunit [Desulfopila sp. IMCC35006]TKB24083.1 polysulfide reductase NrfD [Desulfopila sp. IMCC35006]